MSERQRRFSGLDLLDPPEQWHDIERRDPRSTRPTQAQSSVRRAMIALVTLVLAAVVLAWAFAAFTGPPRRPEPPSHPAGSSLGGISLTDPPGWYSSIDYLKGTTGPLLTTADFPLKQTKDLTTAARDAKGIAIELREIVGTCGCSGFTPLNLPLTIRADDVSGPVTRETIQETIQVNGRFFSLYVVFGTEEVTQDQVDAANETLAAITIQPGAAPTPSAEGGRPAAQFPPAPGWWQVSMPASRQGAPITYVSDSPFEAADFQFLARDGGLEDVPRATLGAMPDDGVAIVVWIDNPGGDAGGGPTFPNSAFPSASLPLQLSDAQLQRSWEGQAAPRVPLYLLQATVGHTALTVQIFFGTQHPTDLAMTEAQRMLDGMQL